MKTNFIKLFHKIQYVPLSFIIVFFIEFIQMGYLIETKRLVIHDSFFRFSVQYYLFNNAVMYGELPQWIPYLTHGTTASYWYGLSNVSGILLNSLFFIAPLFREVNFFVISYADLFFDKLVFLIGLWLLSERFYKTKSAQFFVAICALGSSIWTSQVYFNFHFYYAIPLILYFGHNFLDTGKWRYFFLMFNFLFIQTLGNVAYAIPIISLAIFLYFMFVTTRPFEAEVD